MRINIDGLDNELSAVRGIGSYNQMIQEAIDRFGKAYGLSLDHKNFDLNLLTDFNPFQKIKLKPNKPNVIVIHDLISLKYPKHFPAGLRGRFAWWQNRKIIKHLSGVITDSNLVAKEISQFMKLPLAKIKVVYPAAKQIFEHSILQKTMVLQGKIPKHYVLYAGDITWNKNLPRLAKAIKEINQTLVLVGSALTVRKNLTHPWWQSFRDFIQEVGDDKRFIFLGFVKDKDLLWLYQHAKAVVLPSFEEGFGLTWLEAAWQGTPVVVGKTALTQEIMQQGAYYVDPWSVSSIAEGLSATMSGDNRLLVKKQKERAKNFSQQSFIATLKDALYNFITK